MWQLSLLRKSESITIVGTVSFELDHVYVYNWRGVCMLLNASVRPPSILKCPMGGLSHSLSLMYACVIYIFSYTDNN